MSKVFVTSAAGNLGTALLSALHDSGLNIVAGVHDPDKAATFKGLGVSAVTCDFEDPGSMAAAMEGCDKLFLALPLKEGMAKFGNNCVEAAKHVGISYIVRSSGYAASSDAHWRLGREHGMIDQFVEDSEIDFTVIRPNTFMQNFSTIMAEMIRTGVLAMPEEELGVSYIDIRDVANCAAALLKDNTNHINETYAITGPDALSYEDVAAKISLAADREVVFKPVPEEVYVAGLEKMGLPAWNINMLVSLSRMNKLGIMGNTTKAVEYISGTPARNFDAFAVENADAWK